VAGKRRELSPGEYKKAVDSLVKKWRSEGLGPRITSGFREKPAKGEKAASKHKVQAGIASDFVFNKKLTGAFKDKIYKDVLAAGLWRNIHDAGTGTHLHTQGIPPGPISNKWLKKHTNEADRSRLGINKSQNSAGTKKTNRQPKDKGPEGRERQAMTPSPFSDSPGRASLGLRAFNQIDSGIQSQPQPLSQLQQDAIRLEANRNGRKPVLLGGGGPARQRPIISGNQ